MLVKGSTAIDGLSGSDRSISTTVAVGCGPVTGALVAAPSARTRQARTGWAMFFTVCSPWSSKAAATLPRTAP